MAEINLGKDTPINITVNSTTPLRANVPDINYIPDYKIAEQERRANEIVREDNEDIRETNEAARIALYEDLLNKVETDYFKGDKGDTGLTPSISANASITGGTGTPSVSVTRSGTDENPTLTFEFENLKGDKGDAGAIKFEVVYNLPPTGADDTIYLVPISPDEYDNNYEEYIYIGGEWELLGRIGVHVDLTDYYTKGETNALLDDKVDTSTYESGINSKVSNATYVSGQLEQNSRLDALESYTSGAATTESEGTSLTITDTLKGSFDSIEYKGQTSQTGTPTPSSPIPVNVVSGDNEINICGKNLFGNLSKAHYDASGNYEVSTTRWSTPKYKKGNNTQISFYGNASGQAFALVQFNASGTMIKRETGITAQTKTFETNTDTFAVFYYDTNSIDGLNLQISFGGAITTYEPYKGNTYPLYLGVANLFNTTNASLNKGLNANGTLFDSSVSSVTNYISVVPNTTYNLSGGTDSTHTKRVAMFNTNDLPAISSSEIQGTSLTFTTTSTTYFIRIQYKTSEASDMELVKGTNHLSSNPIELCKIGTYQDRIAKSTGKNLIGLGTQLNGFVDASSMGFIATATQCVGYVFETSKLPNTITISDVGGNRMNVCYFNQIPVQDTISTLRSASNDNPRTITIDKSYSYVHIQMSYNDLNVNQIMLNEGTTALPYEPYGKVWYLHKEIGKVVLNGTEGWSTTSAYTGYYRYVVNSFLTNQAKNNNAMNNRFTQRTNQSHGGYDYLYILPDDLKTIYIQIAQSYLTGSTANDFKTWLASNNVSVYYVLATPTNTEITDTTLISQLDKIEKDGTVKGTSNINQINNDLPFVLDVSAFKNNLNGQLELLHKLIEG